MHGFSNVEIDGAAVPDGNDHGVQIVFFQDHVGHFPGHIRAGPAHGDAHVRSFEGRAVVNPVPGHGHDFTGLLQGLHDLKLMGRANPGKDLGFLG